MTADNQATEQENVANQPKYDNGRISYTNQNGKEVKGLIVDTVTEDNYDEYGLTIQDVGKRVFYDSEKPNELQFATDAELDAMGAKFTPEVKEESKESQEPRVENKEDNNVPENIPENSNIAEENIPTAEDAAKEQEVTQTEPDQTAEAEQAVEQMPVDKDGEPIFSQTTPERGHAYIFGEAGLTREQANEFVANNAAKAQKDLDNINKKQPKMGTSIVKFKQQQAEWQQKVEEAQATVDYWNSVNETERAIEEAEKQEAKAKAAEEQAKLHDEAVAQVEQEKIAKAQAEAERQAVGNENPMPAISEKWSTAPKVEGVADEIVLPNGERLAGRYILTESGAASPSHDVNNGFRKTDGFPMDANNNTVNDRDYERDKEAQSETKRMASNYDQRAVQTPVVVSGDGVVLSGNGRTMAGEIAAAQGTDAAYIDYLTKYAQKYGFTPEQVQAMQHPRVVFVPDEAMPYNADTFAKFNVSEMKSQSKTEQAVKLGKIVDNATFGKIVRNINTFDTLGAFYNNPKAATEAIMELQRAGIVAPNEMAALFDKDGLSAQGRELLENTLIGKAFEDNPDAVRMLTEFKSMRERVVQALAEISDNFTFGKDYSLEDELAKAVQLCYEARNTGLYKLGDKVSEHAQQGVLFEEFDSTDAFKSATIQMLADILNENRVTQLKKVLTSYNDAARDSAAGQMDIFSGEVRTKEDILKEVLNFLNYGTTEEIEQRHAQAIERRKEASIQQNGSSGIGNKEEQGERSNVVSKEVDNNERTEMQSRIVDWLSDENLTNALGKSRDEILQTFGNEPEPIAYIPTQYLKYVSSDISDPRIYCGKGYFIDHALRNHAKSGEQFNAEDVDASKYLNIQSVLDNPDTIKETNIDGKRTIVFIKKIGRYFAELTQVEENGKIILHKSMFNQKKEPYAKLDDIRQNGSSSEGGVSSISHTDNSASAISLESRGDDKSSKENISSASKGTEQDGKKQIPDVKNTQQGKENDQTDNNEKPVQKSVESEVAEVTETQRQLGEAVTEVLKDNGIEVVTDEAEMKKAIGVEGQKMSIGNAEMVERAENERGVVMPNLANAHVRIVSAGRHPFNTAQKTTALKKDVVAYAEGNGIIGTMSAVETSGKGEVRISKASVEKFLDDSATDSSIDRDTHLSVLPKIKDVIRESVEAEVHPDYKKGVDGKRNADNGHNPDVLIHRCYGAVEVDGKIYRVKVTLKENTKNTDPKRAYSYEVTKIELLTGQTGSPVANPHIFSNNSITGANLLNGVEKSYDSGKNLLDESAKIVDENGDPILEFDGKAPVQMMIVSDKAKIAELENSPKRTGYRSVVLRGDGEFSSPMAYWLQSTKYGAKSRIATATFRLGEWEEAEEHPELVDDNGKVTLVKPSKKTVNEVDYDPYIHNRLDPVNLQFKDAWQRPDLVYVRTEVPTSDLESGYHAYKAALSVGVQPWNNGDLMLSRYDKPVAIMPWEEVADAWAQRLGDKGVHFDVVSPQLLPLLEARGVTILPPHTKMGKNCFAAYDEWVKNKSNDTQFMRTPTGEVYGFVKDGKIYLDPKVMNANTPIHEYTHLWDNAVQKANPKLWERGVELLKQTPLWEQVKNDPAYADIANDDNLLASEVHSRLSGKEGAKMLDDMVEQAKKKGALETAKAISLKEQVKKWFRDLYTWVRDAFGKWSAADLESLSLDEFVKMPIKVLASGRNMKDLMHKAEQTAIVRENNPAEDDYHTWVRNANDVKTFDEMLAEAERDFAEYGDMTYPDMTIEQLREAKETGYITVYSSKPIKQGIFVTPSRMNAEDYAGGGRVCSKRVPTSSVAWIGQDEGQLADTGRKKITNTPTQMMFIGEKGAAEADKAEEATVRLDNLSVARDMENAKKDAKTIKLATGWERGADGKWRYEIPDFGRVNFAGNVEFEKAYPKETDEFHELLAKGEDNLTEEEQTRFRELTKIIAKKDDEFEPNEEYKGMLPSFIDADTLFNAYPQLKKISLSFKILPSGEFGYYDDATKSIALSNTFKTDDALEEAAITLVHEIQHAIQDIEGFASGGNLRTGRLAANEHIKDVLNKHEAEIRRLREKRDKLVEKYLLSFKDDSDRYQRGEITSSEYDAKYREFNNKLHNDKKYQETEAKIEELLNQRGELSKKYSGINAYRSLAGEVESRNAARRTDMTSEERRASLASETEDVAREDQLFIYDGLGGASREQDLLFREQMSKTAKKRQVVKGFGGIWIDDKKEFAKFVSAVNTFPFEQGGEGIVYTDNHFYSYYRNIDGEPIPYVDVYLNENESQDLVDYIKNKLDGRISERVKRILSDNNLRFGSNQSKDNDNNGDNNGMPRSRGVNAVAHKGIFRKGRYFDSPDLYVKSERVDSSIHGDTERGELVETDHADVRSQAEGLAEKFNTPVRFVENTEEITHDNSERQMRMRKSKGWFNPKTGEVVIVLPNNKDAADVAETIFHEVVAHKGLRELVGEDNFGNFLRTVYEHATEDVRKRIAEKARKFGYDFEKATDEYLADLAEKGFEDFTEGERTIWQKLKQIVLDAINKFLETMNLPKWVKLGDNELRYMLWRSHENLRAGKESPLQKAADIAKREELGMNDMRFRGGETDDVWRDGSIGLEERITNAALRLANNQKGELQLRNNAIQRISNNLKDLLHDMRNRKGTTTSFKQSDRVVDNKLAMTINEQRTFDRTTIKRVTDLARILMQTGYLSDMTSGGFR